MIELTEFLFGQLFQPPWQRRDETVIFVARSQSIVLAPMA
jgi:hypothetical protein